MERQDLTIIEQLKKKINQLENNGARATLLVALQQAENTVRKNGTNKGDTQLVSKIIEI